MVKSEIFKYFIPTIGIVYFTSYMTYMAGITKGKSDMYKSILDKYKLTRKDNVSTDKGFIKEIESNVFEPICTK